MLACWLFGCLFRIAAFLLMFLVSPSRASDFAGKVTKPFRPFIRPWLRQGSFTPSPLQRPATMGHPWPSVALATSCRSASYATTPFTLLGGLCTRLSLR